MGVKFLAAHFFVNVESKQARKRYVFYEDRVQSSVGFLHLPLSTEINEIIWNFSMAFFTVFHI